MVDKGDGREMRRNWEELPHDVVCVIAKRIDSFEDYYAFRGVCSSWRSAATKEKFYPSSPPQIPLLMIPVPGSDSQEFHSLSAAKKFASLRVGQIPAACKVCLESSGWVITISDNHEMSLFHPFSGSQFHLPDYPGSLNLDDFLFDLPPKVKILYDCSPCNNCFQDFEVMILDRSSHQLMFWRHGFVAWTKLMFDFSHCSRGVLINEIEPYCYFDDFAYHHMHKKFYAVSSRGAVVSFERDIQKNVVCPQLVGYLDIYRIRAYAKFYIVELSTASLMVVGRCSSQFSKRCEQYHVLEMDLRESSTKRVKRIWNLGDKAIFICDSSVSAVVNICSFPGKIEANNVYFIRDRNIREASVDVCVCNIEDQIIKPYHSCGSYAPIFVTPTFI